MSKSSYTWASFVKRQKSSNVASRRTSPSRTNGGPCTGMKTMASPPIGKLRSGLRACSVNSDGALATCSSTKSGSRRTTVALDGLTGSAEQPQGLGMIERDADLLQQPPPAALDRGHRVFAQHLVAGHAVPEHGAMLCARQTSARMRGQSTASRTRSAMAESRESSVSGVAAGATPAHASSASR